jgi:Uma2 family endonuclease
MWEGVLHTPPMPTRKHQEFESEIEMWLRQCWARPNGFKVYRQINLASIGGWPIDYRIPDLLLLTPDRFEIDHDVYFEGPPLVVIEIRSPGDDSYEKLPFYAALRVSEVWIIDRDSRAPEIHRLNDAGEYAVVAADEDGWVNSTAAGIAMKLTDDYLLGMMVVGQPETFAELPEG